MIKKVAQHSQIEFEYYQIIKRSQAQPTLKDWQLALKVASESLPVDQASIRNIGKKIQKSGGFGKFVKGVVGKAKSIGKSVVEKGKSALKGAKAIPLIGDALTALGIGADIYTAIKSTWGLLSKMKEIQSSGIKLHELLLPGPMEIAIEKYKDDPKALGAFGKISVSIGNLTTSIIQILGGTTNIIESIVIAPAEVGSGGAAVAVEVGINAFIMAVTKAISTKVSGGYYDNQKTILDIINSKIKELSSSSTPNNQQVQQVQQGQQGQPSDAEEITSQAAKSKDKDYKKSKTKRTNPKVKAKKVKM